MFHPPNIQEIPHNDLSSIRGLAPRLFIFLIFDLISTLLLFAIEGFYIGLDKFFSASVSLPFYSSLLDIVVLCIARTLGLMTIIFQLRRNGINVGLIGIMLLLVLSSIGYTIVKLAITIQFLHDYPGIYQLNYTLLIFCVVMPVAELGICILVIIKNEELKKYVKYQVLIDEEEGQLLKRKNNITEGSKHASFIRVIKLASPASSLLAGGLFALFIAAGANLLMPGYFGTIVNVVSSSKGVDEIKRELVHAIVSLIIIFVVGGIFTFIRGWLFTLAGQQVVMHLRKNLFNVISIQDISYFDKNRTGELTNRLASDTQLVQDTLTVNVSMALRTLVQIVGGMVFMIIISWKLTLVMLAAVPVVVIVAVIYGRYVRNLTTLFQEQLAKSTATAEEVIGNMRTVKSFSHEKKSQMDYASDINKSLNIGKKLSLAGGLFIGLLSIFSQSATIVVVWYGGTLVLSKEMDPGTLLSFLIYTLTVAVGFATMSGIFGELMKAIGAAERIFEVADEAPKIPVSGGRKLDHVKGHIQFDHVSFSYPTKSDRIILDDINLELNSGEVVALVGPSGGGKSTIVSLIERFYDPNSGSIKLDGQDITDLDPEWYRTRIGFVSQEPVLFACSIKDNIKFGNQDLTRAQIEDAATRANATEFINRLENGYDTIVGERGVLLSGGQKQRVAIARALVLDPKILLLDEATSALDAESEHLVQEAIEKAMEGRTVLIIAHRLSTVRNAHKVVVISDGKVIEVGTHLELMTKGGLYKKLVKRQLQSSN